MATFTMPGGDEPTVPILDLNNYFASVVQSNQQSQTLAPPSCELVDGFQFESLSIGSVEKALTAISPRTAAGHDQIPGILLKNLATAIAPNITTIFNCSLSDSHFPSVWKMANITPVYKNKGSKDDPSNYRPISVLPIIARIFEKLVAYQLYNYCEQHMVIPKEQFGFRRSSSCETALISATNRWYQELDSGNYVGVLLLDLSKAFDTVSHQGILNELTHIGCSPRTVAWFASYLTDRLQRTIHHRDTTPWQTVTRGVPQG